MRYHLPIAVLRTMAPLEEHYDDTFISRMRSSVEIVLNGSVAIGEYHRRIYGVTWPPFEKVRLYRTRRLSHGYFEIFWPAYF